MSAQCWVAVERDALSAEGHPFFPFPARAFADSNNRVSLPRSRTFSCCWRDTRLAPCSVRCTSVHFTSRMIVYLPMRTLDLR